MGDINNRLRRIPNSEVWIDPYAVVAVARTKDATIYTGEPPHKTGDEVVTMINFSIRLSDGKAINMQHHDRVAIQAFLSSIGVVWDA